METASRQAATAPPVSQATHGSLPLLARADLVSVGGCWRLRFSPPIVYCLFGVKGDGQ